ncbi:MAG: DUF4391 domain-containing protein [Bacteroidales bacterium]|nr:DUF4391 domain-containing protein [Bacteroidales bacterium]
MYQLPPSTLINKPLYKKAVFEKFNLKTVERDRFDADISRMTLMARVSPATVPAIAEGNDIKGFYVLQVILKHKEYNVQNILLLQKLIPQQIVFALQFEGQTQLCIFHTRLQQSEWRSDNDTIIPLQGLTLDAVWNNLVTTIGDLDATSEESIERQIINREEREKVLQQIESLEKRCRTEKQTHKKYELHQQIVKLKAQL